LTEETLPKYIKVTSLKDANEKSELYSLREPIVYTYQRMIEGVVGGIQTDVEYLMSLREEGKYDNIEKYKRFPITDEEQTLPEGWTVIHHTSKELVGVKKQTSTHVLVEEIDILATFMDWIDDEETRLKVDGLIGEYYRANSE